MNDSFKCRVSRVDSSTQSLNPIIVEFQNGSVRPDAAKRLHCGVYQHKKSKRRYVAVADGPSSYVGQELDDECCQSFLAIRNRKSNEVRLVAASKALLAPVLSQTEISSSESRTYKEEVMDLAKAFGSKKDRRRAEQIDKLQLSVDAVKDNLEASASAVVVPDEEFTLPEDNFMVGLPPCNRGAKTPNEIYQLNDLVGEVEIEELQKEAKRLLEAGETEITTEGDYKYSSLYRLLFTRILSLQGKEIQLRSLAVLTYMEFAIQLLKMYSKSLAHNDFTLCSMSPAVNNKLLDQFAEKVSKGWVVPPEKKDAAMCCVMLIALQLSSKFQIPFDILAETLSCRPQRLLVLCQAVGVTVLSASSGKVATLRLPLPTAFKQLTLQDHLKKKRTNKRR